MAVAVAATEYRRFTEGCIGLNDKQGPARPRRSHWGDDRLPLWTLHGGCRLRTRCGLLKIQVQGLGLPNEVGQTLQCVTTGTNCHSAFAPIEFKDNERGYTCPREKSCDKQCGDILRNPSKTPDQYGPFYRGE